jgi:hypothetical protein
LAAMRSPYDGGMARAGRSRCVEPDFRRAAVGGSVQ